MANPGAPHGMAPVSFRVNQSRPGAAFQLDELSKQIIEKLPELLPNLRGVVDLEGCGHWTQQERPDEVNAALVEFLKGL